MPEIPFKKRAISYAEVIYPSHFPTHSSSPVHLGVNQENSIFVYPITRLSVSVISSEVKYFISILIEVNIENTVRSKSLLDAQ